MKKLVILLPFIATLAFGQDKEQAETLVREGIALHDEHDLMGALAKYDQALKVDKNNFWAMAEKALTLHSLDQHQAAVDLCEKTISLHPKEPDLNMVYVTYGNSWDALGRADKAIKAYDAGLKKFPRFSQLHFNKGITLTGQKQYDDALACFEKSVSLNPMHASSNNAIARLLYLQDRNIPSLLAFCRFAVIEPQTGRSKDNLGMVQKLLQTSATKTGEDQITVNVDPKLLDDKGKKKKANNFNHIELLLMMTGALDHGQEYANETEVERFVRKMGTVCSSMKELRDGSSGFYWDYYAPYFIAMNDRGLLETLGYIVYATSGDESVEEWLDEHKDAIAEFYAWNADYEFPGLK